MPMQGALKAAYAVLFACSPNPRIGCVITDHNGNAIGLGRTQKASGPHAEIMALRDTAADSHSVQGATAYVTLEPCSHHGRTGPCCDALIAAGIKKVVASIADPNPFDRGSVCPHRNALKFMTVSCMSVVDQESPQVAGHELR